MQWGFLHHTEARPAAVYIVYSYAASIDPHVDATETHAHDYVGTVPAYYPYNAPACVTLLHTRWYAPVPNMLHDVCTISF